MHRVLRANLKGNTILKILETSLELEQVTPILNVRSVPQSLAWFERLGWHRSFTWNEDGMIEDMADRDKYGEADYGGVISGSVQIFLCLDAQGARNATNEMDEFDQTVGVWMTWWLRTQLEVVELYARVCQLDYRIVMPLRIQPWNAVEFRIRHPDGHTFRVSALLD